MHLFKSRLCIKSLSPKRSLDMSLTPQKRLSRFLVSLAGLSFAITLIFRVVLSSITTSSPSLAVAIPFDDFPLPIESTIILDSDPVSSKIGRRSPFLAASKASLTTLDSNGLVISLNFPNVGMFTVFLPFMPSSLSLRSTGFSLLSFFSAANSFAPPSVPSLFSFSPSFTFSSPFLPPSSPSPPFSSLSLPFTSSSLSSTSSSPPPSFSSSSTLSPSPSSSPTSPFFSVESFLKKLETEGSERPKLRCCRWWNRGQRKRAKKHNPSADKT
mmetsp:Transcript_13899/g.24397  ORF Transcript_13899/g.24397 Transcript_13899/m.24397 type:complete len:270 (-) Transcript_13899:829-1638(-)